MPGSAEIRARRQIFDVLEMALRREFPNDTVDVSDGYLDNIHVMVVSRKFDGLPEAQKHEVLWRIIEGTDLTEAEKQLISLVLPLSPAEIRKHV